MALRSAAVRESLHEQGCACIVVDCSMCNDCDDSTDVERDADDLCDAIREQDAARGEDDLSFAHRLALMLDAADGRYELDLSTIVPANDAQRGLLAAAHDLNLSDIEEAAHG